MRRSLFAVMDEKLGVRTLGTGPDVLLLHGGIGPEFTWEAQAELAEGWSLVIPWRRGFEPSPPVERQDFEVDARDVAELLTPGMHLVGFSYGGLGVLLAAGRAPEMVGSVTAIEVPVLQIAAHDPEVAELIRLSERFIADPVAEAEREDSAFLALAGLADRDSPELQRELARTVRLARGLRSPMEARPDLDAIARAGVPSLVVSGGHERGLEQLCDLLATQLGGERATIPGKGHAVPRAPGFNDRLEAFLQRAERRRR